jgi:hypothetical protein
MYPGKCAGKEIFQNILVSKYMKMDFVELVNIPRN